MMLATVACDGADGAQGPAGQDGATGPQGPAGPEGPQGPDAFVAYALVLPASGEAAIASAFLKGTWDVNRPSTGVYCLSVDEADPATQPAVVTVEWGQSSGSDLLAFWFREGGDCEASEYEVRTYDFGGGSPVLTNDVAFMILIPS